MYYWRFFYNFAYARQYYVHDNISFDFKLIGKTRPPFQRKNNQKNREIQKAGSRSSTYNTGSTYAARNQLSRYNQEQGNSRSDYYRYNKQRNRYGDTTPSTTPKSIDFRQEDREIYIYNTELPSKSRFVTF